MSDNHPTWRDDAACRGMATALFFPERGEPPGQARLVCASCPVRTECTQAGMSEHFGVWGGLTERERHRRRRRPSRPTIQVAS